MRACARVRACVCVIRERLREGEKKESERERERERERTRKRERERERVAFVENRCYDDILTSQTQNSSTGPLDYTVWRAANAITTNLVSREQFKRNGPS